MPRINSYLAAASPVSSKAISQAAREDPAILDLSLGEPDFGPPPHLLEAIRDEELRLATFLDSVKRYEHSRGAPELRRLVAEWYRRNGGLHIDPEREVMITHGGIEALNLALLAVTDPGDRVAVAEPAYTLYMRSIAVTGRRAVPMPRPAGEDEYAAALDGGPPAGLQALVVNSPENPTGYVASEADWQSIARSAEREDFWVIQDEVYDVMAFARPHRTARSVPGLEPRAILINSCSKKFGVPGLRIGWLVAPPPVIDAAARVHDCLCLGINILAERIAIRLLGDPEMAAWFDTQRALLAERNARAIARLDAGLGYRWPRRPMGGMFLFPDVRDLHAALPERHRSRDSNAGTAVAHYLLEERQVATVPGAVYGRNARDHIRLVNCGPGGVFDAAVDRLARRADG
ncbi:pyridoxal phosphate-dependent aminotransferase [Azospirillum thermophilum]|uniref:Aminotransferase n=1 Tax=Azospirillum thermophilum TaxID=2202148 RepID=A0A2S2D075_9PROT|nr:pyridoxal phosphate-dependent aminotransferase [Azospirillum thermophilum]AWK89867.1 pyridoxal phosphate-dependent aminotransferase [Azospirillum thermophilum]